MAVNKFSQKILSSEIAGVLDCFAYSYVPRAKKNAQYMVGNQ